MNIKTLVNNPAIEKIIIKENAKLAFLFSKNPEITITIEQINNRTILKSALPVTNTTNRVISDIIKAKNPPIKLNTFSAVLFFSVLVCF